MDDDLLTLLQTSKVFSSLPRRICKKLLPKFERIELNADEILYYQGDPSDSIDILLNGKLSILLTTARGEQKHIGFVEPGETVGEMGSLSGELRAFSVKALKNSVLFKLSSEEFIALCHQYPSVLLAIINPLVSRSNKLIQILSHEKFRKTIAFLPANDEVSIMNFSNHFSEILSGISNFLFLSDYDEKISFESPEKIQAMIDEAKQKNPKKTLRLIYFLKPDTVLAKFCFEKIDMLYIIADEKAPVLLNNFVIEKINQLKSSEKTKPELILLHTRQTINPYSTANWLALSEFHLHHHVHPKSSKDIHRLIRFMRNKPVALVLSGGGTRGWGHLGAIKAIQEAGIPIDIIGGTSVGAIIAASFAMTKSYEKTLEHFEEILDRSRNSVSWRNLTFPAVSLFNAKGLTTVLQTIFKEQLIEDLWLPFFCISTNLAKNSEAIHRQGLLWEKLRASVSIPGIIPPMLLDGELHFDGSLLNNLPVDVMRNLIGYRSTIIAVELGGGKDTHHYQFPPIMPFWQALLHKLNIKQDYKFPALIDTFLRSLLVASSLKTQQNSLLANLYVHLDLSRYPMLHSNKNIEHNLIDIGYETTIEQIKTMQLKK